MATDKGTITVTLNPGQNGLNLSRQGGGSLNITVKQSEVPATITFTAGPGLTFGTGSFTVTPTPPTSNDFVVNLGTGNTSMTVTDNDTDTAETTYTYTICAYQAGSTTPVCSDPEIINKTT